jgi:hypothetical protein
MAVDEFESVDLIHTVEETGEVVLTICDHLKWDRNNEHLFILQKKLNLYLDFIQTGQLTDQFPQYKGRPLRIDVACMYEPSKDGERLLQLCRQTMESAGWGLTWGVPEQEQKRIQKRKAAAKRRKAEPKKSPRAAKPRKKKSAATKKSNKRAR